MASRKVTKNIKWAIITTIFGGVSTLLVRKAFVSSLPSDYLGIQAIIANILIIAGFFDMEIESYCNYKIVEAYSKEKDKIKAFTLADTLLKRAGLFVLLAGVLISPLLKLFIDTQIDWKIVYAVYFLQLLSMVIPYFFYSWRLIQRVTQNEYIAMICTTGVTFLENIVKAIILIKTKNFIIFAAIELIATLLIKLINTWIMERKMPYLIIDKSTINDQDEKEALKTINSLSLTKLGFTLSYTSEDLISAYSQGINVVSLTSNYKYIFKCVNSFIERFYSYAKGPISLFAASKENKNYDGFKTLSLLTYLLSSLLFSIYCVAASDFVSLFFGENFTLPLLTVTLLFFYQFVDWCTVPVDMYRLASKDYGIDGKWISLSALVNIILAIILVRPVGVNGVILASVISLIMKRYGRALVVFKNDQKMLNKTIKNFILYSLLALMQGLIINLLLSSLPVSWPVLITKVILTFAISLILNYMLFAKMKEFNRLIKLLIK